MDINHYKNFKIWVSKKGYPCIWIDGKEVKLHVYVWEQANGSKPRGYDIHHKDLTKDNYSLDNLLLVTSSDHHRIHAGWIMENGKWAKKPCNNCKRILPLADFYYIKTRQIETNFCKDCTNKITSERQRKPEKLEEIRATKLRWYHKHYGKNKFKWAKNRA